MEVNNLPNTEFKTLVIRKEHSENFNKEIVSIKSIKIDIKLFFKNK